MELEIKNARITSTHLGYEDHGILTAILHLEYGANGVVTAGQAFGLYQLDEYSKEKETRAPHKACGLFVQRILEVVGVESWEELKGKHIRVKATHSKIHAIGNILKDKWFEPAPELEALHHYAS